MTQNPKSTEAKPALTVACLLVLVTYGLMIDLKGIWTDEGIRLAIINGGMPFTSQVPPPPTTHLGDGSSDRCTLRLSAALLFDAKYAHARGPVA